MNDDDRLILDSVDRFLERHVRPFAMKLEHDDTYPAEIVERMKELGLFGAVIPAEYGGLGLSAVTYAKIIERISRVWMSVIGHRQFAPDHGAHRRPRWARPRRSRRSCRASQPAQCAAAWH